MGNRLQNTGLAVWLGTAVLLFACTDETSQLKDIRVAEHELKAFHAKTEEGFNFGFDLRSSPQEDARQYVPFLKYLEKKTGYRFKLRFTPKDGKVVDDLGRGIVHFAAIGATSYIQAADKYGVIPLARGKNEQGIAEYRSFLVVRKDSPIKTFSDFHGKQLAFGSQTSTQGYLIPRIILEKHGLALDDFKSSIFTGSHQQCAESVIAGRTDICGMQDTMAQGLANKGRLRVVYKSEYFPSSGIAAHKNISQEVIDKVKQALLEFDPLGRDREGLYHWHKTEMPKGFILAKDSDYQILRSWMRKLKISVLNGAIKITMRFA